MRRQVEFTSRQSGERLDRFAADCLNGLSRSQVQRLIRAGDVTVNGQAARASRRLERGDVVRVVLPDAEPEAIQPWDTSLSIVYEDADCVVVDKAAGMVVHPATSHRRDTLVNALLARYPEMAAMVDPGAEAGRRPGIVHRLDKDTSGLIVVARHTEARAALQRQFRERSVEKVYLALLYGRLASSEGSIDARIGRDPRHRRRMAIVAGGRRAITQYTARQFLLSPHGAREYYTLAEVRPVTGRTHQIRVHLAHIDHPLVGDALYGRRRQHLACPRHFLHACRLGFKRPGDGEWIVFESPLPADLQQVLDRLTAIV